MPDQTTRARQAFVGLVAFLTAVGCLTACSGDDDSAPKHAEVGVVFPDQATADVWNADGGGLQDRFDASAVAVDIQTARGPDEVAASCQTVIDEEVQVLILVNVEPDGAMPCLKAARAAKIPTIEADRLTSGGGASYYVSYDHTLAGQLMAQALTDCLDAAGTTTARVAYLSGPSRDEETGLIADGVTAGLRPKLKSQAYDLTKVETVGTAVDGGDVYRTLVRDGDAVDGVIANSDELAAGVISAAHGKAQVVGLGATPEGLRNVLTHDQCATVFADPAKQIESTAELAVMLAKHDTPGADALASGAVMDVGKGIAVPALLTTPVIVDAAHVKDVIDSGYQSADDVCTAEVDSACQQAGID